MKIAWIVLTCCLALFPDRAEAGGSLEVEHYLTYTSKGTRSEARHGHLRINATAVPYGFERIVAGDQSFAMYFRKYHWGDDGYHRAEPPYFPPSSSLNLTGKQIEKGYVLGGERYQNTPDQWIYVEWKGGRAFVDPQFLNTLIKDQGIRTYSPFAPEKGSGGFVRPGGKDAGPSKKSDEALKSLGETLKAP